MERAIMLKVLKNPHFDLRIEWQVNTSFFGGVEWMLDMNKMVWKMGHITFVS